MKAIVFSAVVLLAGCSFIPKPEVETRFVLQPVPAVAEVPDLAAERKVLGVARPDIPADLRGNQLVLIRKGELTYYSGKAWSAPLADMLAAALVRDLAGVLPRYIVTGEHGLRTDMELQTEVHQFATVEDETGTYVLIQADIRLVNPLERTVVRVVPFRYREELGELSTAATLEAYNKGWRALIQAVAGALN